nr:hypothetical protein Iba_scaffold388829CG0010 [Ipomoea batatas]GMD98677.1 hypothetical protein Iba_scaffold438365CG0010 [Ipomoea batatas]GME07082.1 hypothetical protein Iba_scaffold5871CG0010 [Ipomoea batatas]GME13956.1 hypothetical protein Iba_scaffold14887CG0010 [Ipomoea batatas]
MMRPENNEMWATIGNIAREYTVEEGNSDHARNEVARGGVTPPGVEVDVVDVCANEDNMHTLSQTSAHGALNMFF